MARCGCGGACGCSLSSGENTVVTGSGTTGNPWVIDAHVDCDEARACFSAGNGLAYNPATGTFSAVADPQAGNTLTSGPSGLFVPASTTTVTSGPGVLGDGTIGDPVRANVSPWTFPGTVDAGGSRVYVDSSGVLRSEPGYHSYYRESRTIRDYPGLAIPAGPIANIDTPFTFNVTNPDAFRSVNVVDIQEFDATVSIPAADAATSGFNNEESWRLENTGSSTMDFVHTRTTQTISFGTLAPGASMPLSIQAQLGSNAGGSTYFRIVMSHRVLLLPV